jgi:outer membrane cobalamin receptor
LRKLNVNGTYNFNYSSVVSRDPEQDNLPLAGSPRQNLNLSFVFEDKHLTLVVAGNYRDRTLLSEQDGNPMYRADVTTLDFAADFRITDRFSFYTRANNLTNPKIEVYAGIPEKEGSQLYTRDKLGAWMVAGFRMKM